MHIPMQPISLLTLLTLTTLLTPTTARPTPPQTNPSAPLQPHRTWFVVPHSTDGRPAHIRPSYFSPHDTQAQSWLHTQPAAYARAAVDALKTREEYLSSTLRSWIGRERDAYAPHDNAEEVEASMETDDTDANADHPWHPYNPHPYHHHHHHTRPSFFTALASSRYQQAARLYNYKQDYFRQQSQEWLLTLASAPERLFFVLLGMAIALVGVLIKARMSFARTTMGGMAEDAETLVVSGEKKVLRAAGGVRKEEVSGKKEMSEKERFVEGKTKTPLGSPKLDASLKWS